MVSKNLTVAILFSLFLGCGGANQLLKPQFPKNAEEMNVLAEEMAKYRSDVSLRMKIGDELADILDKTPETAKTILAAETFQIKAEIFARFCDEKLAIDPNEGYARLVFAHETFNYIDHRAKVFFLIGLWQHREIKSGTILGSAKTYDYEIWHYEAERFGSADFYFEKDRFGDYVLRRVIRY